MHADMVQDASQGVVGLGVGGGFLHGFADGDAEGAGIVGVGFEELPSIIGLVRGAGEDLGAPGLDQRPPVGFLVVTYLDHEDL